MQPIKFKTINRQIKLRKAIHLANFNLIFNSNNLCFDIFNFMNKRSTALKKKNFLGLSQNSQSILFFIKFLFKLFIYQKVISIGNQYQYCKVIRLPESDIIIKFWFII